MRHLQPAAGEVQRVDHSPVAGLPVHRGPRHGGPADAALPPGTYVLVKLCKRDALRELLKNFDTVSHDGGGAGGEILPRLARV